MMAESGGSCIICKVSFKSNDEEVVCLKQKGAEGINSWEEKRGDSFRVAAGDTVHKVCRKNYTKELPSNIAQPKEDARKHSTQQRASILTITDSSVVVYQQRENSSTMFIMLLAKIENLTSLSQKL